MRILYITQYFPPEIGAGASRSSAMVKTLCQHLHKVTILSEIPSYPTGIVPSKYRRRLWVHEKQKNLDIIRVWSIPVDYRSFFTRMLNYFSFMICGTFSTLFFPDYDIIYTTSPPPSTGIIAYIFNSLRGGKLVFEVRDLWPEAAITIGNLKNPLFKKLALLWENFMYRKSHKIVALSNGISENLVKKGISQDKISVIPNGADIKDCNPLDCIKLRKKLHLEDKFVVIFAGLFGLISKIEILIEVAKELQTEKNIQFLFLGEGIKKQDMVTKVKRYGLGNVLFIPPLTEEEMSLYLSISDVGIAMFHKDDFWKWRIPAKIFNYMGCGIPVILSGKGESADIIRKIEAGIVVEPENIRLLCKAILTLFKDRNMAQELGKNGKHYVTHYCSKLLQAQKLEKTLISIIQKPDINEKKN